MNGRSTRSAWSSYSGGSRRGGASAHESPYATPLAPLRPPRASASHAQPFYSFVSVDDVSSIYNTVASELWRRSYWREIPPEALGHRPSGVSYRDCDLILAPVHGRGAPFNEIGGSHKVQVINYLQGSRTMTLKAELAMLLREWLEAHPSDEPFTPLTYVIYPRRHRGSSGLPTAARGARLRDEREAFLWEAQLRQQQGIGNVWVAKTSHGSKGSGVRVVDGGHQTCDFIDAALHGSSQAVAVQKYVEDPLLILGFKFDMRVWALVDMQQGVYLYREGVLRLSSSPYAPDDLDDPFSHLTNHCIQMHSPDFSSLIEGNEMFFPQFSRFLAEHHPGIDLEIDILSQVRRQIVCTVSAAWPQLRQKNRSGGFQLYGYDFIFDQEFRGWLLEVNGAPAAAEKLKTEIARDIITLCIDSRFPPPGGARGAVGGESGGALPSPRHHFELLVSAAALDVTDF